MSRRLREKRNARVRNVSALLADLRRDFGWPGMACSYGAHDFEFDPMFKRCRRCGATYLREEAVMTEPEHTEETSGTAAEEEASAEAEQAASSEPE